MAFPNQMEPETELMCWKTARVVSELMDVAVAVAVAKRNLCFNSL